MRTNPVAPKLSMKQGSDVTLDITSKYSVDCSLTSDKGASLEDYMKLPVDQYVCIKMPLDASLHRLEENNNFNLTVPPIRFFFLDVSPTMLCKVAQDEMQILIDCSECFLRGSPLAASLNGCFKIAVQTKFTWTDTLTRKQIRSESKITAHVDPPPPFSFFPRPVLERTGSIALRIALAQIENAFVRALAEDYERWATDPEYRRRRASYSGLHFAGANFGDSALPEPRNPTASATKSTGSAVAAMLASTVPAAAVLEEGPPEGIPKDRTAVGVGEEGDDEVEESEDSPAVLTDDICLVPGEPVVRVEVAPGNARRIFTGVDMLARMESVWGVLTDYEHLQEVVPSLVRNEVVFRTPDGGARLAQVGGAKVLPGVTFTARTLLDVKVYTEDRPMPAGMLREAAEEEPTDAQARAASRAAGLERGVFPRPYSITRLPHRDITMQNVAGEGDFEHYQGVWRMQALPNCAPDGGDATRLTYAVEIQPRGLLPVRLIEGRIAADLRANLAAIRDHVEAKDSREKQAAQAAAAKAVAAAQAAAQAAAADAAAKDQRESESAPSELARGAEAEAEAGEGRPSKRRGLRRMLANLVSGDGDKGTTGAGEGELAELRKENRVLRERVSELEGELAAVREVLRRVAELSRQAAQREQ